LTTRWVSNKKQELLTLREYMVISDFCVCYELLVFLVFCVVLCSFLLCLSLSYVLCTQCCHCLCPMSYVPNVAIVFVLCLMYPMLPLSLSYVLCIQCCHCLCPMSYVPNVAIVFVLCLMYPMLPLSFAFAFYLMLIIHLKIVFHNLHVVVNIKRQGTFLKMVSTVLPR
jgi:hypothetical protein